MSGQYIETQIDFEFPAQNLFSQNQNEATTKRRTNGETEWNETADQQFTQIRLEIDQFVDVGVR